MVANHSGPRILYGTAWKQDDTARLVTTAIRQGFRGLDTACQPRHYDEAGTGSGMAACLDHQLARSDLYLQTKFTPLSSHDPARVPYDPAAPLAEQIVQSFRTSLRNLQTDYLDCLVLHSPLPDAQQTLQAWRVLEQFVDSGGVRRLGISNCYRLDELKALCDATRIPPTVVQNRFYATTHYDRDIRAFCRAQHLVYQSFWTLSANALLLAHPTMQALASKHGRTPAQILFRYLTQCGIVPLTGTGSVQHMRESLVIFEFELGAGECEGLAELTGDRP
jgi:diketogulonate reductase-like aldo/keto reductase